MAGARPSRSLRSSRSSRARRAAATPALVLLATVAGFVFAGTGEESAPPLEARDRAAQVTAVRMALGLELFPERPPASATEAPVEAPQPQPFLAGEDQVRLASSATRVRIPSVGIDTEVRSVGLTFDNGKLRYDVPRVAAGQYGSVAPGQAGNLVVAGHVASRSGPAVFRELSNVRIGDAIEMYGTDTVFRYVVTEIRLVSPDEISVMAQTSDATLTLITCSKDRNFADRFIVVGKLAEEQAASPPAPAASFEG